MDLVTSVLAIQEAIIGATSIVLLKAGGTMTGDLQLNKPAGEDIRRIRFYTVSEDLYACDFQTDEEGVKLITRDWDFYLMPYNSLLFVASENDARFFKKLYGSDDFELSVVGKGYILKSPNTTRYRIKVDNAGALSTEAL
ncbi:hypothetical protein ES703_79271 [subsurface metagenome]